MANIIKSFKKLSAAGVRRSEKLNSRPGRLGLKDVRQLIDAGKRGDLDNIKGGAALLWENITTKQKQMADKYIGKAIKTAETPLADRARKYTEAVKQPTIDEIKAAAGMKPKNVQQYIYNKAAKRGYEYSGMLDNKDNFGRVAKGIGVEEEKFASLSYQDKKRAIADWVNSERLRAPGLMDKAQFHRVPQKVLGGTVLGGTVLAMSGSRGRQSNAQLYGQQPRQ